MDPRRKKIYIIIIVACLILSAGILGWTFFSGNGTSSSAGTTPPIFPDQFTDAGGSVSNGFTAPAVFPANSSFGTDVLDSTSFKKLKPYKAVDVTGQLGRPDPFRSY
ncbi:MAG: hypothetical protein KW802_01560 [Candidatus Doudnabacteria bacterium]|nr:hypothetical protein [Candidatus Doudnabacteria bacterium]